MKTKDDEQLEVWGFLCLLSNCESFVWSLPSASSSIYGLCWYSCERKLPSQDVNCQLRHLSWSLHTQPICIHAVLHPNTNGIGSLDISHFECNESQHQRSMKAVVSLCRIKRIQTHVHLCRSFLKQTNDSSDSWWKWNYKLRLCSLSRKDTFTR